MCESNMAKLERTTQSSALLQPSEAPQRVWLPHLEQRLKAGRELGNAEDRFAITVYTYSLGEHSDDTARADDNPI